jgi:hypothetical protein
MAKNVFFGMDLPGKWWSKHYFLLGNSLEKIMAIRSSHPGTLSLVKWGEGDKAQRQKAEKNKAEFKRLNDIKGRKVQKSEKRNLFYITITMHPKIIQ